ncbi:laccase-2-like isoform X1 [Maniola jurtina]|uniref:laccase-2-like isoform X1 n=1 Tax=Maniola jurtina TaxID=191418 RepID=UPI001E68C4E4|nr:laccase-2-like isoform X1 [Maniola jurtina]
MKLLILCLYIIANLSYNGKASLESFMPTKDNMILADTTKGTHKSCSRPCKFNVKPRRCTYDFEISPSIEENGRPTLTINNLTPGPSIKVCLHDIVIVKVKNKVPNQDVTLHWHGVEQKGTPYMDGVPMITQCPIVYGSTYEYAFIASNPGTFFYHSDSVNHQSDGVYGTFIVDQPQPLEPHSSLYDYDRSEDHTMIIGTKFNELLTGRLEDINEIRPDNLVVNGDEMDTKIFVIQGYGYRFRFINAIALECPLLINVERHPMTIITSDASPVRPVITDAVRLYPGERMDVVVRANQRSGGYWIRVSGEGVCDGLNAYAMLLYSGFNYTNLLEQGPTAELEQDYETIIYGQQLRSLRDMSPVTKVKSVYLSIDKNAPKFKDSDIDFSYRSDAMSKKPFFPAVLASESVLQINGKNFLYPNAPYLLKSRDVNPDIICNVGEESEHKEPQCLQVLKAEANEVLDLVLANEGLHTNDTYTFHMHGKSVQVIATWENPTNTPVSKADFLKLYSEDLITRNARNPPIKDTVAVPNKGFTVLRYTPTFGGSWLLECRSCSTVLPVAILITVPLSIPKLVVDTLPSCGNYRPADTLLN